MLTRNSGRFLRQAPNAVRVVMNDGNGGNIRNGILLAGRVLLASCFIPSAIIRASNISGFAASLSAAGLPYTDALAALIVLVEVFGPLAVILGLAPRSSACALLGVSVVTTGVLHRFWEVPGVARHLQQAVFMSQIGIISALLLYIVTGPGAWSWHDWWKGAGEKRKPAAKKKSPRPRTTRTKPGPVRPVQNDDGWVDAA